MAEGNFRVSNQGGMWIRKEPVISKETEKVLLPNGHLVTKLADSANPDWWQVRATVQGTDVDGFSNKNLLVAVDGSGASPATGAIGELITKTLAVLKHLAPNAHPNYLQAIREGGPLFEKHGITTPLRMAHFLAQAMTETGAFTVLRESMSYRAPRILEIFGVGHHSAKVTAAEAPSLAHNEHALAERVYGLGNPSKAHELGNTEPGDGFRYRGNGVLQMTGRAAHHRRGLANGLDFEGNPDLATLPEHALKPALQEWADGNLNHFADVSDIRTITLRINGGLNGFKERKEFFAKLLPLLSS
jgi:putative chitinase